ncbi:hypothetical protein LXA43DRAFT_840994, partial [Ganoderma leucocontextum]
LHPRYKTQYFRNQGWPEEWINAALQLMCDEWISRYKRALPANEDPATSSNGTAGSNNDARTAASGRKSMAASSAAAVTTRDVDLLEAYLEAPPLSTIDDPLAYWNVRMKMDKDTSLAQMAIDYLLIPGM